MGMKTAGIQMLRMIWDFTDARDPENNNRKITMAELQAEFGPDSEEVAGLAEYGVVVTFEES